MWKYVVSNMHHNRNNKMDINKYISDHFNVNVAFTFKIRYFIKFNHCI